MTKTSIIQVDSKTDVYIINKYKCFIQFKTTYNLDKWGYEQLINTVEAKLQCKILPVRYDERVNVIEFYIIGELGAN